MAVLFTPTLQPAENFFSAEKDLPQLHPFAKAPSGTPYRFRPQGTWEEWWDLPKSSLVVSVAVEGEPDAGDLNLDAALSVAVTRSAEAPWYIADREAWVVPLPLALLGVVELPHKRSARRPRLPVWASTTFAPISGEPGRWSALCIGHGETVRELLSYIHEVGKRPARGWKIEPWPVPDASARAIIATQRPMPASAPRWTPPYHYDWVGKAEAKLRGGNEL